MLYSKTLLFIHSVYNSLRLRIPNSQTIPPQHPLPLGNHRSVLCICKYRHVFLKACPPWLKNLRTFYRMQIHHVPDTQWGQTILQCGSLEQRKVYCRAMNGERWLMSPNTPKSPKGFSKAFLKAKWGKGGEGLRVCDQLHGSLIGWRWGNRVVNMINL